MRPSLAPFCTLGLLFVANCTPRPEASPPPAPMAPAESEPQPSARAGSFADDLSFLQRHTKVVVLKDDRGMAQVAVAPDHQGRVMTSTAGGPDGDSHGWLHRPVIALGQRQPHMTVLGGEDRFWLGPEGGQFGLYFAEGAPFDFEHWQVPAPLDWGAFDVASFDSKQIAFTTSMTVTNHSGTTFSLGVRRTIRLLDDAAVSELVGIAPQAGVRTVAFESDNVIENTGAARWTKETGLVSIWILGMFTPSPDTTVVVPVREGDPAQLGPQVKDDYFGAIPEQRLVEESGRVFFRADGRERGKIGVPRARALPFAGSYAPARNLLTLVHFTLSEQARDYVDSRWQVQQDPYAGDVANSYNDGPPAPGQPPLGPFYELESSSPVLELSPGESLRHVHRTFHFEGSSAQLDPLALASLGVTTTRIAAVFGEGSP